MRSQYHHIELSKESQPKSSLVTPMGKFEFTLVCFRLAEVSAYFQRFVNEVLIGLVFAFGYLGDILVFSPDIKIHIKHLEILFQRF